MITVDNKKVSLVSGDNGDDCSVTPDPRCRATSWSEWSPCSASCDDGVHVRTRLLFYAEHEERCASVNLLEKENCQLQTCRRLLSVHSKGFFIFFCILNSISVKLSLILIDHIFILEKLQQNSICFFAFVPGFLLLLIVLVRKTMFSSLIKI